MELIKQRLKDNTCVIGIFMLIFSLFFFLLPFFLNSTPVSSDVKPLPQHKLSYTEPVFSVSKKNEQQWAVGPKEGIYTFFLSEGSVVTSLSLWINGKEEPGVLTNKANVHEAYTKLAGTGGG